MLRSSPVEFFGIATIGETGIFCRPTSVRFIKAPLRMNSLNKSLLLVSLLLAMQATAAQDSATATAEQAADTAVDAKQTSDEAKKAADQAQKTADETAKKVEQTQQQIDEAVKKAEQTSAEATSAQAESAADLQKQLNAQKALIATQAASGTNTSATLADLQRALNEQKKLIDAQKKQIEEQQTQLQATSALLTNMQSQIDQLMQDDQQNLSDDDVALREQVAKLESQVNKIPDDPSSLLADEDFPGAIRVPGTTAAYKIGGFVKASLVKNKDPLVTQDRFIVGSIPVTTDDAAALAAELSLTANQSRLNFDYLQRSEFGNLRAFIEGDFEGSGDTFRLRHAFGQFRDVLAGKTWSAFYDAQAAPEDVDFEGTNGRVIVRQTQIRYFPQIGKNLQWMISLEDPNPQVTGGSGVSTIPDLVTSIRRDWFSRWHVKSALLLRQIGAIANNGVDQNGQPCEPSLLDLTCVQIVSAGAKEKVTGWALTASGKVQVPWWNENDNFLFQLNYGDGIGRYLNDLNSVASLGIDGGQDAIIDPATGKMEALPAFGGYLSFQHWWTARMRSTFLVSLVNVNNLDAQPATAYHETQRATANLIWSPISNIDIGGELLWGKRTNKGPDPDSDNAQSATATQIQLEAVYRF